jgi:hypothetical protein
MVHEDLNSKHRQPADSEFLREVREVAARLFQLYPFRDTQDRIEFHFYASATADRYRSLGYLESGAFVGEYEKAFPLKRDELDQLHKDMALFDGYYREAYSTL